MEGKSKEKIEIGNQKIEKFGARGALGEEVFDRMNRIYRIGEDGTQREALWAELTRIFLEEWI